MYVVVEKRKSNLVREVQDTDEQRGVKGNIQKSKNNIHHIPITHKFSVKSSCKESLTSHEAEVWDSFQWMIKLPLLALVQVASPSPIPSGLIHMKAQRRIAIILLTAWVHRMEMSSVRKYEERCRFDL
jgi:hypothetical protein